MARQTLIIQWFYKYLFWKKIKCGAVKMKKKFLDAESASKERYFGTVTKLEVVGERNYKAATIPTHTE